MKPMEALFTRAEYNQLPEGFPAQLIEGQLVKEPPPLYGHQRSGSRLRFELMKLLGPDLVPDTPCDVIIDDYNVFQPDIVVLKESLPGDARHVGIPVLAVEILSPRTEKRDRQVRTLRLLDVGVAEVWLVDWRKQTVERHTKNGHRVFTGGEAAASNAVDGFRIIPAVLFST